MEAKLKRDFQKREREINEWYAERINKNKKMFFRAIAEGQFIATRLEFSESCRFDTIEKEGNVLRFGPEKEIGHMRWFDHIIQYENATVDDKYIRCAVNGAKAYYKAIFEIDTDAAIAKVAGVTIEELPKEIRDYRRGRRYSGNSILERIDPVESIENPFHKMNFWVDVYLSKSGYRKLLKVYKR